MMISASAGAYHKSSRGIPNDRYNKILGFVKCFGEAKEKQIPSYQQIQQDRLSDLNCKAEEFISPAASKQDNTSNIQRRTPPFSSDDESCGDGGPLLSCNTTDSLKLKLPLKTKGSVGFVESESDSEGSFLELQPQWMSKHNVQKQAPATTAPGRINAAM
ncbi:hypothetical protein XELAEV_18015665mg [Xenopus laevis]|uniref:Cilium assembly protein DZIP1 domain-containing protein n=1 Tax=Xenopus laevis TaxID=8355 RepID=A0A974DIW7_XENLA|nr:hypothetical protein XELAEV_18015665mg [Xenopus laevis]